MPLNLSKNTQDISIPDRNHLLYLVATLLSCEQAIPDSVITIDQYQGLSCLRNSRYPVGLTGIRPVLACQQSG